MLYIMFIESNRNKTDKHSFHLRSKEVCVFSATYPNLQLMKHYEHKANKHSLGVHSLLVDIYPLLLSYDLLSAYLH